MYTVTPAQLSVYERDAMQRFEDEMVKHSQAFSPKLTTTIGEDQLRVAVKNAIRRAESYGFTLRGPIRLYIELMFLFGSGFDNDPLYPDIRRELNSAEDQMVRAEHIWQLVVDFIDQVMDVDSLNLRNAIVYLIDNHQTSLNISEEEFDSWIIQEVTNAFPQKVAYVGNERLVALIKKGRNEAKQHKLTTLRGQALFVLLFFIFGSECTNDPLYPWIQNALYDERIQSSESRAKRLETRALTWLNQVLTELPKGTVT